VKVLTGGNQILRAREPMWLIRLKSGADSMVWMEEESVYLLLKISPEALCSGYFYVFRKLYECAFCNKPEAQGIVAAQRFYVCCAI
jgi:hypothetical protein